MSSKGACCSGKAAMIEAQSLGQRHEATKKNCLKLMNDDVENLYKEYQTYLAVLKDRYCLPKDMKLQESNAKPTLKTELDAKIEKFLQLKWTESTPGNGGIHFNEKLLQNFNFKNPNIYQKLLEYADLEEFASHFRSSSHGVTRLTFDHEDLLTRQKQIFDGMGASSGPKTMASTSKWDKK